MTPYIIDRDTGQELWDVHQCAEYCDVSAVTWRSYVQRNLAPSVAGRLNANFAL